MSRGDKVYKNYDNSTNITSKNCDRMNGTIEGGVHGELFTQFTLSGIVRFGS